MTTILLLVGGLVVLTIGAEWLVRSASQLAARFGIPPLVIGLTVVACGTGAPELAVCIQAALAGQAEIALGNVVGSNIMNILVILGLAALITPLIVAQQLIRIDVPLMIGASILVFLLALDGRLGALDGAILSAGIVAYMIFAVVKGRRENNAQVQAEYEREYSTQATANAPSEISLGRQLGLFLAGLALLILGANLLVRAAVDIAAWLGISQLIIGLTVVAIGTSLPEIATTVIASLRGQRDIAVGNAIGSNLFNLLAVLGVTSLIAPDGIAVPSAALSFDLLVMIAVALACLPIFFTGHSIARWEGLLFLAYYAAYTGYLILRAQQHPELALLRDAFIGFILPLTAVTLIILSWRYSRRAQTR